MVVWKHCGQLMEEVSAAPAFVPQDGALVERHHAGAAVGEGQRRGRVSGERGGDQREGAERGTVDAAIVVQRRVRNGDEGRGVDDRRVGRARRVREAREFGQGVVAVGAVDRVDLVVGRRDHHVAAAVVEVVADGDVAEVVGAAAVGGVAVLQLEALALEVAALDEVDHARHRVGAVQGRRAAGDDVDPVQRLGRDGVHVHRAAAGAAADLAVAVDQHQGAGGAQVAQADLLDALVADGVGGGAAVVADAHLRGALQQVDHVGEAGELDVAAVDDRHGIVGLQVGPHDARAGDHHLAGVVGVLGRSGRLQAAGGGVGSGRGRVGRGGLRPGRGRRGGEQAGEDRGAEEAASGRNHAEGLHREAERSSIRRNSASLSQCDIPACFGVETRRGQSVTEPPVPRRFRSRSVRPSCPRP